MNLITYKTQCGSCKKELINKVADFAGANTVIIDFINDMEFYCKTCETSTYIQITKFRGENKKTNS